jgi:hypothetical protein
LPEPVPQRADDGVERRPLLERELVGCGSLPDARHLRPAEARLAPHADQTAGGEALQRVAIGPAANPELAHRKLRAARDPAVGEHRQGGALAAPEPAALAEREPAGLGRGNERLEPGRHVPTVAAGPGWKHQLETAPRGRAVFAGNPQAEADELRRRPGLQGFDRLRQPLGWQVACLGQLDHHANHPPAPERNHEQASDAHPAQAGGKRIVERPAEGASRGQGLDLCDRH